MKNTNNSLNKQTQIIAKISPLYRVWRLVSDVRAPNTRPNKYCISFRLQIVLKILLVSKFIYDNLPECIRSFVTVLYIVGDVVYLFVSVAAGELQGRRKKDRRQQRTQQHGHPFCCNVQYSLSRKPEPQNIAFLSICHNAG